MINSLSQKRPWNTLLVLLYFVLTQGYAISHTHAAIVSSTDGVLYQQFLKLIAYNTVRGQVYSTIIGMGIIIYQCYMLTSIVNKLKLYSSYTYVPAVCYLLCISIYPYYNTLNPSLIINAIMLIVIHALTQLQNTQAPKTILFNVGIYLGIAYMIHPFGILLSILVVFSILLYRAFQLKDYILLLLGILLPLYIIYALQYISTGSIVNFSAIVPVMHIPYYSLPSPILITVSLLVSSSIMGMYNVQLYSSKMNIQARKAWGIWFIYTINALLVVLLYNIHSAQGALVAMPLSLFVAASLHYIKSKLIKNILHYMLLALVLYCVYTLH